jgi:hypothetical protein
MSAAKFNGGNEEHVSDVCIHKVDFNRKILKWLTEKRTRLLQYFEQKKPTCIQSNDWWIVISLIQPVVERVEQASFYSTGNECSVFIVSNGKICQSLHQIFNSERALRDN